MGSRPLRRPARLSKRLLYHGFHVIAVDSHNQHQRYEAHVTFASFSDAAVQSYMFNLMDHANDMDRGMPFIGKLPSSGNFEFTPRIPKITVKQLEDMSEHIRLAIIDRTKPLLEHDLDEAALEGTQEELDRGCLQGPFSCEELDKMFEGKWLCGRRFAIKQGVGGEKIRIDDFSISKVNSATYSEEKIVLQHVDAYLAMRDTGRDHLGILSNFWQMR